MTADVILNEIQKLGVGWKSAVTGCTSMRQKVS
jgi:hypothetical protein